MEDGWFDELERALGIILRSAPLCCPHVDFLKAASEIQPTRQPSGSKRVSQAGSQPGSQRDSHQGSQQGLPTTQPAR